MSATISDRAAIGFDSVDFSFGDHKILDRIDLTVKRGEIVCVIGPSGCGKTTMLRLIAGLLTATSGAVTIDGRPVRGPSPEVAVVFQDYGRALLPWRTAAGNISLALEATGVAAAERPDRIAALLNKVGLASHAHKHPSRLSGGQQQRLQIARCLAQEPTILLMDEPFGALDAMTRQHLQDEVFRVLGDGVTVFFVTHDLDEALYLGDRVVALYANPGRMARVVEVPLPRPRNQLSTREHPEFLRLRRELFTIMEEIHA
jgi:NitT/TauT family transport system ATP-binding protein